MSYNSHSNANSYTRPHVGIAVDASCTGGNPGNVECRGVDIATNQIVFSLTVGKASNNIGEFLAITKAIEYLKANNLNLPIYSDSKTAIGWARKKQCNTKIFIDYPHVATQNPNLKTLIANAIDTLYKSRPTILFWSNKLFKEIPADYNRKKGKKKQPSHTPKKKDCFDYSIDDKHPNKLTRGKLQAFNHGKINSLFGD